MAHTPFRGNYTVCLTAFDQSGALDLERMAGYVEWQIAQGVDGLIPLGSTGEFLSLSREERSAVAECVIRTARGRVPVLIGSAAESTEETISLSQEAEALGADGVMVIAPFYSSPTPEERFTHFRRVAESLSLPVMVYNNPFTANIDITAADLARLSEIDNILYVKDTSKNVHRVTEILDLCQGRLEVFAGYYPWESCLAGAVGYSSVVSNIAPTLSTELVTRARNLTDWEASRALYRRMLPLINALGGDLYVPATKAAMRMIGQDMGPPRSPRLPLPAAAAQKLRAILAAPELGLLGERQTSNHNK
ncbi:dihydrodipicolinate synthase family protein [Thioclava kandeliae]|uniref:Dihydrodipicolinate synthase family protein n=1 Tax=Thioclava kandeliae TaxID=3070818 RepID=A0ABV1SL60_9RHOB